MTKIIFSLNIIWLLLIATIISCSESGPSPEIMRIIESSKLDNSIVFPFLNKNGPYTMKCFQNDLKYLEHEKYNLNHIESLVLSNKELQEIPEFIFDIKSLKYLDISYNKLKNLSSSILRLSSLEELVLTNNQIKNLPDNITQLKKTSEVIYSK